MQNLLWRVEVSHCAALTFLFPSDLVTSIEVTLGRRVVRRTEAGNLGQSVEVSHHCGLLDGKTRRTVCCLDTARLVILSAVSDKPTRLHVGSLSVKVKTPRCMCTYVYKYVCVYLCMCNQNYSNRSSILCFSGSRTKMLKQ